MTATNGLNLNSLALDPGSTKRLIARQANLKRDSDGRLFQREPVEVLKRYMYPEGAKVVDRTLDYLYYLKDAEGRPFCRSLRRYADLEAMWDSFQNQRGIPLCGIGLLGEHWRK
jgi:hypothetical protein